MAKIWDPRNWNPSKEIVGRKTVEKLWNASPEQQKRIRISAFDTDVSEGAKIDWKASPTDAPFRMGVEIAHAGIMFITPEQYEDDVNAFIYYGTAGLIDPTIPGEIKIYRMKGFTFKAAVGITFARAMLGFTLFMWLVDPKDKREGGWAEEEWYKEYGPPSWVPRWERNWDRMF